LALEIIEDLVKEHGGDLSLEALRVLLLGKDEEQKPCHHQYGSGNGKCRKCGSNIIDVTN
jgi:hypothetical protein